MLAPELLHTVAAVVREGSFERAARALHITPSAVSQRVRLIEERVGAVLVVRGQPCRATQAGAHICRHAQTLALLEHDLRRELPGLLGSTAADARGRTRATLRVAVNADSLVTWFVHALQAFAPGLDDAEPLLDISTADQDDTVDWLASGRVHAAVTAQARPVQGCRSRRLGALRYHATASPAFVRRWLADGVSADALARAPSLVFGPEDRLQETWVRRNLRRDVLLPAHRLPSTRAFVDAALSGTGWGLNPAPLVREHLAAGRLVELLPGRHLDVPLYWQCARLPVQALQHLSRCVTQAAAHHLAG